jgi:hypothetical protein
MSIRSLVDEYGKIKLEQIVLLTRGGLVTCCTIAACVVGDAGSGAKWRIPSQIVVQD